MCYPKKKILSPSFACKKRALFLSSANEKEGFGVVSVVTTDRTFFSRCLSKVVDETTHNKRNSLENFVIIMVSAGVPGDVGAGLGFPRLL